MVVLCDKQSMCTIQVHWCGCYYYSNKTERHYAKEILKAQSSEAAYASRIKRHNSCGFRGSKKVKKKEEKHGLHSFRLSLGLSDEAVDQVKAKLQKVIQSERSNCKDVRPDESQVCDTVFIIP